MGIGFYIFITIIFVIALILTLYAFNRIDKEIKEHEENEATFKDEMNRSLDFETSSIKKHLPVQIWLYAITIIGSLVALAIYLAVIK